KALSPGLIDLDALHPVGDDHFGYVTKGTTAVLWCGQGMDAQPTPAAVPVLEGKDDPMAAFLYTFNPESR
ncbi:MAG: hypothetical protein AAFP90_20730, partial [Planctomycetota bacterium]